jgi:mannose-6-phosphate isomerase-like protein (cupin superfamily)
MPMHIAHPTIIPDAGSAPKIIREFVGHVNTGSSGVSIAQMSSPPGWEEPGQRPEFDEYTVVLRGSLRVEFEGGVLDVRAGEGVITHRGEWVRYGTPGGEGADYVAVCIPAFSPESVHRDPPA